MSERTDTVSATSPDTSRRPSWRDREHPALAAYLLGQGLRSVIRSVLDDMPAQMESAAFLDSLVGMAMGCLQPATFD